MWDVKCQPYRHLTYAHLGYVMRISVPIDQVFKQLKLYMKFRSTSFPVLRLTVTVIHPVDQGLERQTYPTYFLHVFFSKKTYVCF